MRRLCWIVLGTIIAVFSSNCTSYQTVVCQVTGTAPVTFSNVVVTIAGSSQYYNPPLPWSKTFDVTLHGPISLTADTGSATTGSVTVTITVNGALLATSTATANGSSPATASVSGVL